MSSSIFLSVAVFGMLILVSAAQLISSTTYENCIVAVPGDPCIYTIANSARDGNSWDWKQYNAAPCGLSADGNEVLISEYDSYSIRRSSNLSQVFASSDLNCESVLISRKQYGGNFLMTTSSESAKSTTYSTCFCEEAGNCRQRRVEVSGDVAFNFSYTPAGEGMSRHLYNVDQDVLDARVVVFDCTSPEAIQRWQNPPPGAVLLTTGAGGRGCPGDYYQTIAKFAVYYGYVAMLKSTTATGFPSSWYQWEVPDIYVLNVHEVDRIKLNDALVYGNESVFVSFGPSFIYSDVIAADVPNGLAAIDSTGTLTTNTSTFKNSIIFEEGLYGGSSEVVWAVVLDGSSKRLQRIDYTDPSNPTTIDYVHQDPMQYLELNCTWIDFANQPLPAFGWPCVLLDPESIPFEHSMSMGGMESNSKAVAFFSDGGSDFVVTSYMAGLPCKGCLLADGYLPWFNLDLWDITTPATPVLADRIVSKNSNTLPFGMMTYAHGNMFYSNFSAGTDLTFAVPISATAKLDNVRAKAYRVFPNGGSADAIAFERYMWDADTMIVNWGKDGSVFYTLNSSGIAGVAHQIPTQSNSDPIGGAIYSCGSGDTFVRNDAVNSAGVNGVFSFVTVEVHAVPFGIVSTTTGTTSSTTTSGSSSSTSSTTSSSTTNGGNPSASAPPAASASVPPAASASAAPSCPSPDSCKYDCTYVEPSKLPKPSVQPSKEPAATKEPESEFFIIELTYESSAAECGPDCCEVREWLGDDSIAASFYMCSADSETKNRAPAYDAKKGTCSIFLAAQEGSDLGEITQSEFDAAVATLEGNFASLCPVNPKNCDVSTQSGKTADYIIGSASCSLVSAILVISTLLALL